ncbi:MAG: ABC transporter ATP-binding protein [Planctomycetes bacterium]|nr:ABC transporter ATP-binding protein [Planctomycetota bacterium]
MIETQALTRRFGRNDAVLGLDLRIEPGEIYGFLGPNGAGKTTTLRMLAGLLRPTAGTIRLAGRTWQSDERALRRLIGFVPDTPPLHDFLTGRQHVDLVAALFDTPREQRDADAERLLRRLDLADRAHDLCKGYSQGMRKKIHLAAVLATRPRILLLDEPTTGLDPKSVRVLKDLLLACRDDGATVLLSTHVLEVAEELSDRIGVIAHGRLRAEGTMAELRARRGGGDDESLERILLGLIDESEGGDAQAAGR